MDRKYPDENLPLNSVTPHDLKNNGHTTLPNNLHVAVTLTQEASDKCDVGVHHHHHKQAEAEEGNIPERETWGKKIDFLLSMIGFAVDLANVWRFPYLCYKNGGGAFLIPYFSMLLFGAIPLFLMELILGQYHREGCISVWKIVPIFKGIGIAECMISYYVAFYYNVIIAWSLYYLLASFTSTLPWMYCGESWNTLNCYDGRTKNITNATSITATILNTTAANHTNQVSAATEYFERGVLGQNHAIGLEDVGGLRWQLVLCLGFVFVILYFSLWKGVKTSGKVVWVTATMPYMVLFILFIRGVTLPGSGSGILYFITPRLDRLNDPQVWIDAAVQIFYSVGAGFGTHLAYASYNKFHNNCYQDCLITCAVNSFTSLFSGVVIFSYLGYMAFLHDKNIQDVATEGPGLVFVVYPQAIATLPGSSVWAVIFFLMLITLGLDSAMGGLEAVMTGIIDQFKGFFGKYRYGREIAVGFMCLSAYCFSLPNVTHGGIYMLHIWDKFAAGTSLLLCVFTQAVAVAWFYGIGQLCDDVEEMLQFRPGLYWRLCWKFVSPIFLLCVIISSFWSYTPLSYDSASGTYVYPPWANVLGWGISCSSMIMIPIAALYQFIKSPGNTWKQKLALCISPKSEHSSIQLGEKVKRFQKRHWLRLN